MDWVCGLSEIIKITIYSLEVIFCTYMSVRFLKSLARVRTPK
jgi:hypothetical protein